MADVAARKKRSGNNSNQHERRSGHGVDEELCCGVNALVISPFANEEVHRYQNDFEKHEEQEQVEAEEAAHDASLKHQHPYQVLLVIVMRINSYNHQWEQDSSQHHKEERNSIDAQMPRNSPLTHPRMLRDKFKTSRTSWELDQHPQAE